MNKFLNSFLILIVAGLLSCSDGKTSEAKIADESIKRDSMASDTDSAVVSADKDAVKLDDDKDTVIITEETTAGSPGTSEGNSSSVIDQSTSGNVGDKFAGVPNPLNSQIEEEQIPTVDEVGINSYPTAYIIKLNPTEYRGEKYMTMELASPDEPEEVLKFYQKQHHSWSFVEGSGVYTFKKDKDKYFRETNNLQILSFNKDLHQDIVNQLSFSPRSLIRIYYKMP